MNGKNVTVSPPSIHLDELKNGEKKALSDTSSEHENLVQRSRHISTATAYKLRIITLVISWISVVYLGIMGVIVFVMAFYTKNSTAFAFSLDALLDCASSVVVIWRYWGSTASLYSSKRERIACIVLGILFIGSFLSICTRSVISLSLRQHPKRSHALWVISLINGIVCIGLMASKAVLAMKLESIAIATDAVNSGIGVVMALTTVLSDVIYDNNMSVWYIDPITGIVCSVFLLAYGVWVIVYQLRVVKSNGE